MLIFISLLLNILLLDLLLFIFALSLFIIYLFIVIIMDITGSVIELLPERRFSGRNGEVVIYGFVIRTAGQYPRNVCFSVFGQERWERMRSSVVIGSDVQVFFEVSSRKYKESWFTQCDAYRVNVIGGAVVSSGDGVGNSGSAGSVASHDADDGQYANNDDSALPF